MIQDETLLLFAVNKLSPLFTNVILDQIDVLTTRKLGELLEVENIMDAKIVKDELIRLKSRVFRMYDNC